jgi:hypothetical protein
MILSKSKKFIFIKTRKCGGTSIQNTLLPFCNENDIVTVGFRNLKSDRRTSLEEFSPLYDIIRYENIDINEYFKFGFARNPFSITLSRYFYQIKMKRLNDQPSKESFNRWAKNKYFTPKNQFNYLGDGTKHLLFDNKGNQIVDFIGKLENIDEDFEYIKDKLGIDKNVKVNNDNKSNINNVHYRDWVDEETKLLVEKHFKFELDYFKYEY